MTKGQRINFFREIKNSLNRYLSILFIVALGVAFYTGIRSSEPDMKLTADEYLDEQKFMDVRILGTLGLTEDDRAAIENLRGVAEAEGIYSGDYITQIEGTERVLTAISVPEDISRLYVTDGRLPLKSGECLMDELFARNNGYQVGDTITLYSGTEEDISESLVTDTYTIVGIGKNPYYLTWERGNSSIGNGSVAGFLAIQKADFKSDVYTQIYVRGDGAEELLCYSDEYEEWIDTLQESIEAITSDRCEIRYQDVIVAGWDEVDDAKAQLSDAQKKLDDGQAELDENRQKLEDAQAEYDSGMEEIAQKEQELADGRASLEAGKQELDQQEDAFEEARIQVVVMETVLSTAQSAYERNLELYYELLSKLSGEGIESPEDLEAWLEEKGVDPELWQGVDIEGLIQAFKDQLDDSKAEIDSNIAKVAEARAQLDWASSQLTDAKVQIQTSELQLEDGQKQLNDAKLQLANAKQELDDGWAQLEQGESDLAEARTQFEEENADALAQIADAEEKLNGLDYPEWYVLDRGTIQTYVEFGQDAESIGKLAEVFPMIFFLVAALVSLTTMTRMVEEERLQIGTMKALGYGKAAIASKYVFYALSASLIGSILGLLVGGTVLPFVVITAYKIMYENLIGMQIPYQIQYSFIASGLAIGCTVAATIFACWRELLAEPAALMRPEAPKQGRRVFLERIGFIWKHLTFSVKSTIRNLMRYKKRFFMTIFGIGACMALLLVGFGLRDSIMVIVDNQYQTIWVYDMAANVDTGASEDEREELEHYLSDNEAIAGSINVANISMDFEAGETVRSGNLIVPEDIDDFAEFTNLHVMETGEPLSLDGDGVIITEKLARILDVKPGDTIYLKVSDTEEYAAKILGVTEHYMRHVVYASPAFYEKVFGEAPEYNQKEILLTEDTPEQEEQVSTELLAMEAVQNVSLTSGLHEQVESMLHSLDLVVWVLIISAGLLAFVVLYNLNNINITERRRELATLKVLGFYDKEVAAYVYRENIFLTIFGMAAGVFLGIWLHRYVIATVEIDMLLFGREISTASYIYGILLTVLFSVVVNVTMYYKLKKIDMVESLKSVE